MKICSAIRKKKHLFFNKLPQKITKMGYDFFVLHPVEMKANEVELSVTEYQLRELTGFVASEANHAESKKKENELDRIFNQLEVALNSLD